MKKSICLLFILSFLLLSFSSCYKYPDLEEHDYSFYNRVIGPKGGIINFFANYSNDTIDDVVVKLEVPEGALDSVIVFNMYQFGEYELASELNNGFVKIGTKFLYFVPFYASEGYYEHDQVDVSYHLSIQFNEPITVTYNYLTGQADFSTNDIDKTKLYYEYFKTVNQSFKLYKIKIPRTDEWGQENNIRINWNTQGYPVGYNSTDLTYIINGAWSQTSEWGSSMLSLENWEEVTEYTHNPNENTVVFDIEDTDYLYVIARVIQINEANLPPKIINFIDINFPDETILHAAFSEHEFYIYMANRSLLIFDKKGNFDRLLFQSIFFSEITPQQTQTNILNYINNNYPEASINNISYIQYGFEFPFINYRFTLSQQLTLLFDEFGSIQGIYHYGIGGNKVPQEVFDYISTNHSTSSITNITFDSTDGIPKYIVYLSDNSKVYFMENGQWITTVYFNYEIDSLPEGITNYFTENFSDITIALVHYEISEDYEYYHIALMNSVYTIFTPNAELNYMNIPYFEEENLPDAVQSSINARFQDANIQTIDYFYDSENSETPEVYVIYFENSLNVEFLPDGTITYLYGNSPYTLPPNITNYISDNYHGDGISEYEIYYDYEYQAIVWHIYLDSGILLIFDIESNFIEEWGGFKLFKKHKKNREIRKLKMED